MVDVVMLTKATNGLVYMALKELTLKSRQHIGNLILCYTGDDKEELMRLNKFLDDIPVSSTTSWDYYNFAKLNNKLVKEHVESEHVLFMNDDVILQDDALGPCLELLKDKSVGAVGIKLVYPNRTIQHAGVFAAYSNFGECKGVGHMHWKEPNRRLPNYDAVGVTGAFLMMRTADFKSIGGFDERFKHCFEDVVLCKRLRDKGMRIICNNSVEAIHFESVTRKQASCREDIDLMISIMNEK